MRNFKYLFILIFFFSSFSYSATHYKTVACLNGAPNGYAYLDWQNGTFPRFISSGYYEDYSWYAKKTGSSNTTKYYSCPIAPPPPDTGDDSSNDGSGSSDDDDGGITAGHGTSSGGSFGDYGNYDEPPCSSEATCKSLARGSCNVPISNWDYTSPNNFSYDCNLSSPQPDDYAPCSTYSTCQSYANGQCGQTAQEFTFESPENFSWSCPLADSGTGGTGTGTGDTGTGGTGTGDTGTGDTGTGDTGDGGISTGETDHGGDDSTTGGSGGGSTGGGGDITGETGSGGGSTGGSTGGDSTGDGSACVPTYDNDFCQFSDSDTGDDSSCIPIQSNNFCDTSTDGGSTGGSTGQDGQDGTNGTNGTDGQDGQDGTNGTNGTDGQDGQDGTNGTNGTDGQDGEDGEVVNMQQLIDYLSNTSIDLGDWSSKSENKFDTFSQDGIPNEIINVQDDATSYLSGNGVSVAEGCPNPESIVVQGEDVLFSYQPLCDLATMLNPLLLAFTWMSALVLYFRSL